MKTTLTIEQSAELIKRGVTLNENDSEVFDIGELLSLLPNNYPGDELDSGDKRVYLTITAVDWNRWMAKYSTINKVIAARTNNEMIDSVYEILLWAIDNNHVKLD